MNRKRLLVFVGASFPLLIYVTLHDPFSEGSVVAVWELCLVLLLASLSLVGVVWMMRGEYRERRGRGRRSS